jgi:hypothetical protein
VDEGDEITLEAIPAEGYHFAGWEGEPTIRRNPAEIEVIRNIEITAVFELDFIEYASGDGLLNVSISTEATALDGGRDPLTNIEFTVVSNPPLPHQGSVVEPAYDLEPSGATFDPPAILTWAYNAEAIPEGVAEEDLIIAYYHESWKEWIELEETEVNPEQGIITAPITHLTTFAVLAPPTTPPPELPAQETNFTATDFVISPQIASPGEEITISVLVTNEGETEETQSLTLKVNGVVSRTEELTLGPGAFTTATFTVSRNEAGTYLVELLNESGEFTVEEEINNPTPPPSSTLETPSSGVNWVIMAPVLTAVFLAIFLPIWRRRRRDHFDW